MRELRETVDRITGERDELKGQLAELRESQRTTGLAQAGVKADSMTGQAVLAAADRDGITSADDIAALARVIQAEARGELTEVS
jgi:spore germination cell wall hydrolase CwlJ-like protein